MSKKSLADEKAREKTLTELDKNMLVEAGAGSGKTTVLIDRMVALLGRGDVEIGHLAAVTFTRKAAAEMRERLQIRLEEELRANSKKEIARALTNLNQAYVGTIHSFCARLLRERPVEAGIDPAFEEIEGIDEQLLNDEAWEEFLLKTSVQSPQVLDAISQVGIKTISLKESYLKLLSYPDVGFSYTQGARPDFGKQKSAFLKQIQNAIASLPRQEPDGGWDDTQETLRYIDRLLRYRDISDDRVFLEILKECEKEFKVVQKKWDSKDIAKQIKADLETLRQDVILPALTQWRVYRYGIVMPFLLPATAYCQAKRLKESKLNFQDLLMLTANMLREHASVREYFASRYRRIFVDEFQDTDPIQAEMLFLLTGLNRNLVNWRETKPAPGSLFIVGDPKQSIYRFRRADIDTYNEVKGLIQAAGGEVVQLTSNFRSTEHITTGLNKVFKSTFPESGTRQQAPFASLNSAREVSKTPVFGIRKLTIAGLDNNRNRTVAEADAEKIAAFIDAAIHGGMTIPRAKSEPTSAMPGDFLILVYRKRDIDAYARALEAKGIPFEISGGTSFSESEDLQALSDLLNCLNDPADQILLFKTLRGKFFGISDDQFYQFKSAGGYLSFFVVDQEIDSPEPHKDITSSLPKLRSYWESTQKHSPAAAIEMICDDLGILPLTASGDLAGSSSGNVAKALEMMRSSSSIGSFDSAAEYLQTLLEAEEVDEFSMNSTQMSVVRLMNLHKAKGLEAPVVFLANPSKIKPHEPSIRIERTASGAKGYIEIAIPKGEFQSEPVAFPEKWEEYQSIEAAYDSAEKDRLLYVAATRARDLLVISTQDEKPEASPWNRVFEGLGDIPELEMPKAGKAKRIKEETFDVSGLEAFKKRMGESRGAVSSKTYETVSVTSLSHRGEAPAWVDSGRGMAWGRVVHRVLALCKNGMPENLEFLVKNLLVEERMEEEKWEDVADLVEEITKSEFWKRMLKAKKALAEVPFVLQTSDGGLPTILSGAIDLVFQEADGWVIVDYKTDTITGDVQPWVDYYRPQVDLYARHWSEITGEVVKEKLLFFTHVGRAIQL